MISLEVGVADEAAGIEIASLMMGGPSPKPGTERPMEGVSVLRYLRSFVVPVVPDDSAERTSPAVWVDFGITYDNNAEADPIVGWLFETLKRHDGPVILRVDTTEIPLESGAMTALIRKKVEKSV
jgi:hypothetical protein